MRSCFRIIVLPCGIERVDAERRDGLTDGDQMQRDGVNAVIAGDQCDKPVLCAQHILRTFVVVQNVIGVDEIQCVKVVDAFILQLLNPP